MSQTTSIEKALPKRVQLFWVLEKKSPIFFLVILSEKFLKQNQLAVGCKNKNPHHRLEDSIGSLLYCCLNGCWLCMDEEAWQAWKLRKETDESYWCERWGTHAHFHALSLSLSNTRIALGFIC